jgi:hypothetical protein
VFTANGKTTKGTYLEQRSDTLVIRPDSTDLTMLLPLAAITRLQSGHRVHDGKRVALTAGVGLALGTAAGYVSGPILGTWSCLDPFRDVSDQIDCSWELLTNVEKRRDGAFIGAAGGLVIGTVVGLVQKTERWRDVPIEHLPPPVSAPVASIPSH